VAESNSSPRIVNGAYRKAEALRLRAQGHTFREIAELVGYGNPGTAHEAVMGALAELTREPAEELRKLELLRLDALQQAVWSDAMKGHLGALDRVLKIMERRAKLAGLDEPSMEVCAPPEPSGLSLRDLVGGDPDRAMRLARSVHEAMRPPQSTGTPDMN
jgi:hypothetical protein